VGQPTTAARRERANLSRNPTAVWARHATAVNRGEEPIVVRAEARTLPSPVVAPVVARRTDPLAADPEGRRKAEVEVGSRFQSLAEGERLTHFL
jgi:hypothetical protein